MINPLGNHINSEFYEPDWQTPDILFNKLHAIHNFTIDAAASPLNAKLPKYWTKSDNSLLLSWKGERPFCNPPFDYKEEFIEKSYAECLDHEVPTVMLLPSDTSTEWSHKWYKKLPTTFLKGRVAVTHPDKGKRNGNNKGSIIFTFHKEIIEEIHREKKLYFMLWDWKNE